MVQLKDENPGLEFYFIIGSDLLATLSKWFHAEKLLSEVNFLIFVRIGYKVEASLLPMKYIIVNTTFVASSSTEVRTRIRNLCIKLHDHSTDRELLLKERQEIDNMSIESNEEFLESIITAQSTGENGTKEVDSPTKKSTGSGSGDEGYTLEEKYLGVFGIVPVCIIDYAKRFHLYCQLDSQQHILNDELLFL
eukprot:TRINITY_DN8759_c0_g1_i5.p1 TRINITY_DN8759_c0_g1~~TRINITY_DN8759_c0_g1_i5.p1  ORF type:complete len:193 (+),score=26.27 TRINITY_DN8759_c0_g1_i5:436-1014(+)